MNQITNQVNFKQEFTNNAKTEKAKNVIVTPQAVPKAHLYNDIDASYRLDKVNKEIKTDSEKFKNKTAKRFLTFFGVCVAVILTALGLKRIFK